jgi:hypothetical protein
MNFGGLNFIQLIQIEIMKGYYSIGIGLLWRMAQPAKPDRPTRTFQPMVKAKQGNFSPFITSTLPVKSGRSVVTRRARWCLGASSCLGEAYLGVKRGGSSPEQSGNGGCLAAEGAMVAAQTEGHRRRSCGCR